MGQDDNMATYATTNEIDNLLILADPETDTVTTEEIEQAELDIDDAIGLYSFNQDTERKLTPANLYPYQRSYLKRAVAAQIAYRRTMGPEFFNRAQFKHVETPDFTRDGVLPYIAPKANQLLAQAGLSRKTGRITSGRSLYVNWFETAADEED